MLDVRTWHRERINVPVYAFQSALTGGGIFARTKRFIRLTRVRSAGLVGDEKHAHLDPLLARPRKNTFLQTVVPFLGGV
jgi:hypothetical protein